MNTPELPEYDDVGDAIREGRPLLAAKAYRIQFAIDGLDFRPLAAQALARAGDAAARPYLVDGLALPTLRVPSAVGLRRRDAGRRIRRLAAGPRSHRRLAAGR